MTILGYIGERETFDDLPMENANRYAHCTQKDHAQLWEAIDDGRMEAVCDLKRLGKLPQPMGAFFRQPSLSQGIFSNF